MRDVKAGSTSVILDDVFIQDSSSTTGAGLGGLVFNTASLTCYYHRNTASASVSVSLATMTLGTWATGGFKEVDATNMKGMYSFCPPDAAVAAGAQSVTFYFQGAANMAPRPYTIQLTATDVQDAMRGGMTALPNIVAEGVGGLYTRGTGAGQINQPANGRIDVNTIAVSGTSQTARDIGASVLLSSGAGAGQVALSSGQVTVATNNDKTGYTLTQTFPANFSSLSIDGSGRVDVGKIKGTTSAGAAGYVGLDWSAINAPTTTVNLSGTTIAAVTGAVGSVTGNVGGNVNGNVVGSIGSFGSGSITSTTFDSTAITSIGNAVLDQADAIETGWTLRMAERIVLASQGGKLSGADTGSIAIRNVTDTKDRISSSTDTFGNRPSVTLDGT